jgi:hypothetical protein
MVSIDVAEDRDQWRCSCERGNVSSGSVKAWEGLKELHNGGLLKKGSAP